MNYKNQSLKNIFLLLGLTFYGCKVNEPSISKPELAVANVEQDTFLVNNEHSLQAVLWHQASAEYRALAYQAYNFAQLMLDIKLSNKAGAEPAAVIVDIDETILDNSAYNANLIKKGENYSSESWKEWSDLAEAEIVPGSMEFINYVTSKGVEVFYVSNRKANELESTIKNLKTLGFEHLDQENFYLRTDTSGKQKRRQKIQNNYDVLLLVGDNLNDFSDVFEEGSITERKDQVDKMKKKFGFEFIVLPNAMYGEWEGALYDYNYALEPVEKDSIRKKLLKTYE